MKKSHWKGFCCLLLAWLLTGCARTAVPPQPQEPTVAAAATEATIPATVETEPPVAILSYAEFLAAPLDAPVTIETYVQACQAWWNGTVSVFCQGSDGGYFLYNLDCSQEDVQKLVQGTKIRVSGYKAVYRGAVEVIEGSFSFVEGETYIAQPYDVTDLLGTGTLIDQRNKRVCFRALTVAPSVNEAGKEVPFLYKEDGSGKQGDSLYFRLTDGSNTVLCTVNRYFPGTDKDSDVYKAVEKLKIGSPVDAVGFLYWQDGPMPQVTAITAAK